MILKFQKRFTKIKKEMVSFSFKVHNGKRFVLVKVNENIVGFFFREFVNTKKFKCFR
jgi:small subunit ribosomal protein S19